LQLIPHPPGAAIRGSAKWLWSTEYGVPPAVEGHSASRSANKKLRYPGTFHSSSVTAPFCANSKGGFVPDTFATGLEAYVHLVSKRLLPPSILGLRRHHFLAKQPFDDEMITPQAIHSCTVIIQRRGGYHSPRDCSRHGAQDVRNCNPPFAPLVRSTSHSTTRPARAVHLRYPAFANSISTCDCACLGAGFEPRRPRSDRCTPTSPAPGAANHDA
jgi:hypothetical protein